MNALNTTETKFEKSFVTWQSTEVKNVCVSEISEEPAAKSESLANPSDSETLSQTAPEQGLEQGYESDVTDSGSEQRDIEMDFDNWSATGASVSRDSSLNGDKGEKTSQLDDEDSLNESSASRSGVECSISAADGYRKNQKKGISKAFWKDSDGAEEISSDSESVPTSFSNPIHGKVKALFNTKYIFFYLCMRAE